MQFSNVSTGLALRGCELNTTITLYGTGFYRPSNATWTGVSRVRQSDYTIQRTFSCLNVTVLSNTTVTCALLTADEWSDMRLLTDYRMIICDPGNRCAVIDASNAFIVSFGTVAETSPPHSSNSSHVALVASLATVLSVLAVGSVAIAAYCLLRRHKAGQRSSAMSDDGQGAVWSQDDVRSTRFIDRAWTAQSGSSGDGVELSRK